MGIGGLVMGVIITAVAAIIFFPKLDRVYDQVKKYFEQEENELE